MTPEEFKKVASPALKAKHIKEVNWGLVVASLASAPAQVKTNIETAIHNQEVSKIGTLLLTLIHEKINVAVDEELDTILTDNQLSLDEYDRIFGKP